MSVFFALQPDQSVIGDVNPKLVNAYRVVRDFPKEIERKLQDYQALHIQFITKSALRIIHVKLI